ncbi:MAG: PepSY-associated TM helix domain-containing protein [Candidatus Margulisiibacteriota bacterium]
MTFRRSIFWIHLTLGVILGLAIALISLTGALLAFKQPVLSLSERKVQTVVVPAAGTTLDLNKLAPKKATAIQLYSDPSRSIKVTVGRNKERFYLNPYSGEIVGKASKLDRIFQQIEGLHRWFGIEGPLKPLAAQIKALVTVLFVLMIVSGFYLWWKSKNLWLSNRKPGLKHKSTSWHQHAAIGFWSSPFLLVICLTGLVLSSAQPQPNAPQSPKSKAHTKTKRPDLDAAVNLAKTKVPNWKSITVRMGRGPLTVFVEETTNSPFPKRSKLTLKPSGEVLRWEPASSQNRSQRLMVVSRYLHTGEAGGLVGETLAFLAALAAVVLVWTGFVMAWQRFLKTITQRST